MAKSREDQKSRRQRRDEERKMKKFGPLYRKLQQLDVQYQIMTQKLAELSGIMRNFTVCILVMKEKGLITDDEVKRKDAELVAKRNAKSNKDSQNPKSGVVQPEGTGDDEGNSSDGGRELSGESNSDSSGGGESITGPRETRSISSEINTSDAPDSIGGDD